jgi:hypothetical protein
LYVIVAIQLARYILLLFYINFLFHILLWDNLY